jgi:hypothetical protein
MLSQMDDCIKHNEHDISISFHHILTFNINYLVSADFYNGQS